MVSNTSRLQTESSDYLTQFSFQQGCLHSGIFTFFSKMSVYTRFTGSKVHISLKEPFSKAHVSMIKHATQSSPARRSILIFLINISLFHNVLHSCPQHALQRNVCSDSPPPKNNLWDGSYTSVLHNSIPVISQLAAFQLQFSQDEHPTSAQQLRN